MNTKGILVGLLIVLLLGGGIYAAMHSKPTSSTAVGTGPKNATYIIDGTAVTLVNGVAVRASAPGSASKTTTKYFGNDVVGDINGDGKDDIALFITQESGGTGIFFYIVAALATGSGGYQGTNALFLGDRIAPQTISIQNGVIVANYADRAQGEPMTAQPSVGVSKYVMFKNGQLVEKTAPIANATYVCNADKKITAAFYDDKHLEIIKAGDAPRPTGSVELSLDGGQLMTLMQTISADGGRYANADGSLVFWSKGRGAIVLENNVEKNYTGCVEVAHTIGGASQLYHHATGTPFTIRYPEGYTVDEAYVYTQLGKGKDITGVKFTIPDSMAAGTNLSTESYVSVETLRGTSTKCIASMFLADPRSVARDTDDNGELYSFATSSGAAAGNRYEEAVFALPGTSPCVALRYFIHYGVFENYATGTVREFDKLSLLTQFDSIRRTLVVPH